MHTHPQASRCLTTLALLFPVALLAQNAPAPMAVTINGHSGQAQAVHVNGKTYLDVESLARISNGAGAFQANQLTLTVPGPSTGASARPGFSIEFLRAGIEEMTVIREWRVAILNAVQNNNPVSEDWVSAYRRNADSKLALASAAATTSADRQAFPLLQNEFNNMQKQSNRFLALHQSLTFTPADSLVNDPLDQQILSCAQGLAALAANNHFEDVAACH